MLFKNFIGKKEFMIRTWNKGKSSAFRWEYELFNYLEDILGLSPEVHGYARDSEDYTLKEGK